MAWVAAAVSQVLIAVVVAWLTTGPDVFPAHIDAVNVVPGSDERTIKVSLTFSSCMKFRGVDVAEDASTVRFTAHVVAAKSCGETPTTSLVVPVWLERPLRQRSIVDGSNRAHLHAG
ncbi:hypothetical protein GCM10027610_046950 [Dactylosporangium cerinum]